MSYPIRNMNYLKNFSLELSPKTIVPAAACIVIAVVGMGSVFSKKTLPKSMVINAVFDAVWCWATYDRPWVCGIGLVGKKIALVKFGKSKKEKYSRPEDVVIVNQIAFLALSVLFLGGLLFSGIRALPRPPWAP